MAANPISYSELEAYERKALVTFTSWEADLLMRLDDAILAVWRDKDAKPAKTTNDADVAVPASDTKSMRSMLSGIAQRLAGKRPKRS